MEANQDNSSSPSAHLPFWKGRGYRYVAGDVPAERYSEAEIEFNLPVQQIDDPSQPPVSAMGKLITKNAANAMYQDYLNRFAELLKAFPGDPSVETQLTDLVKCRVIFGKEALLFLLAQPNCEGVRFYSCVNPLTGEPSLLLVGVDKDKNDLQAPTIIDTNTIDTGRPHSIIDKSNDNNISKPIAADLNNVARQTTAIVEVGGTDGNKLINILEQKTIVTLSDELRRLNLA